MMQCTPGRKSDGYRYQVRREASLEEIRKGARRDANPERDIYQYGAERIREVGMD